MALLPGKKVIVRSNEFNDPLGIGECVGLQAISKAHKYLPIVKYYDVEYICFALVALYTEELYSAIKKLSPKEQYEYLKSYNMNRD